MESTAESRSRNSNVNFGVRCSVVVDATVAKTAPAGYEERLKEALEITRESLNCTGVAGLLQQQQQNDNKMSRQTGDCIANQERSSGTSSNNKQLAEVREMGDPATKGSNIALCFNAGKDSIVTLELMVEVAGLDFVKKRMILFMFAEDDEFPELATYRADYLKYFKDRDLDLIVVPKMDWAKGLTFLKDKYKLEGVILGTRSTDPDGKYQSGAIAPTTGKFPPMVRYCPVFNWLITDIWYYLAVNQFPISSLYKEGYTSLGSQSTTRPNPHLLEMEIRGGGGGSEEELAAAPVAGSGSGEGSRHSHLHYRPAWELSDCSLERAGRGKKPIVD